MNTSKVKDILIKERKNRNLSQQELADIIKISRGAYAKYETGKNIPPLDIIIRIANFYNVSLDYLSGRY